MATSKPMKNPFILPKKSTTKEILTSPSSLGVVATLGLAVSEKFGRNPLSIFPASVSSKIPRPVLLLLLGLPAGYAVGKSAEWLKWKVVQRLLEYDGWVNGPKSTKTMVWGMLMKLLATSPDNTFTYQRYLPKQPLPDLDHTLDLWLDVSSHIVNKEEFHQTQAAVERFRQNEGPKIQEYLQARAKKTVNWLYEYWMTAAYLSGREPIAVNSNYFLVNKRPAERYGSDQMVRSASAIDTFITFYELLANNTLAPVQLQGTVPLCMNGYRYIFNSLREPGEQLDRIVRYPGETHIVVIRKGHYYQLELYTDDAKNREMRRRLRPEEIKVQLERICEHADNQPKQLPVAALTSLNRTKWAKLRETLAQKNANSLRTVEGSMFMFCIDDQAPHEDDHHEHCRIALTGRGDDRWFDKCFTVVTWPTGTFGCNVEHSGIDAMVFCTAVENLFVAEPLNGKDIIRTPEGPDPNLPPPIHMTWDLDYMEKDIMQAYNDLTGQADDVDLRILNTPYGKGFMKKARLSPDGYIQMALQLAYHKLHKETPKTYEPSTARLYALGRTENINPVSTHSKAFVRSMSDPSCTPQSRRDLLAKAVRYQNKARLNATIGQGCDRHLLGMYCASREMDMDVPGIFTDKAWRADFKLSTSQTPTRTFELKADLDFRWVLGGFAAVCNDGYGVSYVHMGDNLMNFQISSWNSCETTSSAKMSAAISEALEEMKALFS